MSFNRYSKLYNNGRIYKSPNITVPKRSSDYYIKYVRNSTRLDNVSYNYYGDPNYGWLILMANPEVGGLEFNIPNGTEIRIPFPLEAALNSYNEQIDSYNIMYGSE